MMRRFALGLNGLAVLTLPRSRKRWGDALSAELGHITEDHATLFFAGGCLIAAIKERTSDFETRFAAGIWSVALATGVFAFIHVQCALRGMSVLLGGHDGFLDSLMRAGRADATLTASYHSAMPFVIVCVFSLGLAHFAAAYFLFRMELRRFLFAWCAALPIAMLAVVIQLSVIWTLDGLPSEFFALLVQMLALPALLLWSNGRHRQMRSAK